MACSILCRENIKTGALIVASSSSSSTNSITTNWGPNYVLAVEETVAWATCSMAMGRGIGNAKRWEFRNGMEISDCIDFHSVHSLNNVP